MSNWLQGGVEQVAPRLVGAHLIRDGVRLRVTEVEAYGGPADTASHARFGPTARNRPMWEAPGQSYVYLCYGIHWMLNVVAGSPGAILIRSCEVVRGVDVVLARRGQDVLKPDLLAGPGKVGQALELGRGDSGQRFGTRHWGDRPGIRLLAPDRRVPVRLGPRVGIGFADEADQKREWRFADAQSGAVTQARRLRST